MSFQDIANPFINLGIKVFPLQPGDKAPISGMEFITEATVDPTKVASWNDDNSDYNVAILADDDFCFLEFDIKQGMAKAADEMEHAIPKTRVQRSGGGFGHFIFTHTDRSRAIGNRSRNLSASCTCSKQDNKECKCGLPGLHHHHEWFSFRASNRYLVGAGSLHPSGSYYKSVSDVAPIPFPDWLCYWIEKYTVGKPSSTGGGDVSDEFDFDDMMDFFDIGGYQDGDWFITDVCPISGKRHKGSKRTGFFWDGSSLGWHCFAQGCEGSSMSIGKVIACLNAQKGEPYTGVIWDEREDDDNGFDVEIADDIFEEPADAPKVITDADALVALMNDPQPSTVPVRFPVPAELLNMTEDEKLEMKEASDRAKAYTASVRAAEVIVESKPDEPEESAKKSLTDPDMHYAAWMEVGEGIGLGLLIKNAATYQMTELQWLWPQRIPKGKIVLYTGKPDCGKSIALLDLIACVTTGKDFPDGAKNDSPPSKVLLAASEDDPQDTLIPRLVAAGANLALVEIVVGTVVTTKAKGKRTDKRKSLDLKRDAKMLLDALKQNPDIRLLCLDPLTSFMGDADQNKDKDIRPIMDEVSRMCSKSGITIVGIIHSNKRSDVDAVHKVSGAGSLAASVRAVWGFSRDSDDKKLYRMAFVKGNLGKVKGGIKYGIEETFVTIGDKSVGVPKIVWGEQTEEDADDLLRAERNRKDTKDAKEIMAIALIKSMIPCRAKDIFDKAEKEGIQSMNVKRAKFQIENMAPAKKIGSSWWWYTTDNPPKSMALIEAEKAELEEMQAGRTTQSVIDMNEAV